MSKKVWISRSQPGASALAHKLAISKISVMQMPVLTKSYQLSLSSTATKVNHLFVWSCCRIYVIRGVLANKKIKHLAIGRETASILGSRFAVQYPLWMNALGVIGMKEVQRFRR